MGDALVIITGLSFLLLTVFRWSMKAIVTLEERISTLHIRNGELLEAKIRAMSEAERLQDVNKRLRRRGRHYKEKYLEQALENEDLMNRIS